MAEKFAFESDEVSIAFTLGAGLGDCVVSKKVFDALIELVPRCVIDIFYGEERHRIYAEAFYGGNKNLNLIMKRNEVYQKVFQNYDLALLIVGNHYIQFEAVNQQRLQAVAPVLLESLFKVQEYNNQNLYGVSAPYLAAFRDMTRARILHKNCYEFLSCDGALPIRDDKVNIALKPEYKPQFDALKLDRYITIYSDVSEKRRNRPKNKTWPIQYLREYVARMKKRRPDIAIIQCGGGYDVKIENVDRHFLGCDLELAKYILANSLLHVGCEGGLIHLATALGTKCLVFFGSSDWHYYGYEKNINIASTVCEACMYIRQDYACLRGKENPPCMSDITPQEAFAATNDWLKNNA